MPNPTSSPPKPLNLTPAVFNILMALTDGEKHGFAIMLRVEANTAGQMQMGPGTLYGSINRMLIAGLIEQSNERVDPQLDDQRRRYYRLTALGQRTMHMEAERMNSRLAVGRTNDILGSALVGGG